MTPGQAAYKEWAGSFTAFVMGNAEHMLEIARFMEAMTPKWETLNEAVKGVWEAIAKAAINQHIDNRDAIEQAYEPPTY